MIELPDLNVTALAAGKGYQGKEQGRYGRSKRGLASTGPFDMSGLLWYSVDTSTEGAAKITMKKGWLAVSEYQSIDIDGTWSGMRVLKNVEVEEEEITVAHETEGQFIYLKVEYVLSAASAYRAQFQSVSLTPTFPDTYNTESFVGDTGDGGIGHTHPMDHSHSIVLKAGGKNQLSAGLLVSYKQYASHEYVLSETPLVDTDDEIYFKMATIVVADDVVTSLTPHIIGCPITIPLVSVTYGDGQGD